MAVAQGVDLPDDFRTEQIYLSPEHTAYYIGDTIRVAGVVTSISRDGVKPYSLYLYLELIGPADTVITRRKLPCHDGGRFNAAIPIELMGSGTYTLRAYTRLMRNFNPLCFAFQPLWIGDRKTSDRKGMKCHIAAEGGRLTAGQLQNVTGVVLDSDGVPVAGSDVRLMTAEGDTVATTTTSPSGYASFCFIPQSGTHYEFAVNEYRFPLPDLSADSAPKITGTLKNNRIIYSITGTDLSPSRIRLYVFDRMNGLSFAQPQNLSGTIALARTPDVATVFMTDADNNLLAEFSSANPVGDPASFHSPETIAPGAPIAFLPGQCSPTLLP